jgi:hypothetical protein
VSSRRAASRQPAAVTADALSSVDERPVPAGSPTAGHTRRDRVGPRHPGAFVVLERVSFAHSCVYLSLLVCAFALGKPQPATFVLGLTHGLLWIAMSLACIAATRLRIVPLRLAVAVAVLGGIGPFFGSAEFIREQRRRERAAAVRAHSLS